MAEGVGGGCQEGGAIHHSIIACCIQRPWNDIAKMIFFLYVHLSLVGLYLFM